MTGAASQTDSGALDREVRLHIFRTAEETGKVPQASDIADALHHPEGVVEESLTRLGAGRALILAPSSTTIWAADPFCAVPSAFRVEALARTYWGICIWDALGIPAALASDGVVSTRCADCCGDELVLEVKGGEVAGEGVVHFAVPAARFWENIGFT